MLINIALCQYSFLKLYVSVDFSIILLWIKGLNVWSFLINFDGNIIFDFIRIYGIVLSDPTSH